MKQTLGFVVTAAIIIAALVKFDSLSGLERTLAAGIALLGFGLFFIVQALERIEKAMQAARTEMRNELNKASLEVTMHRISLSELQAKVSMLASRSGCRLDDSIS